MAKLEAELDQAGLLVTAQRPQPRAFTWADVGKLTYLDCVIKARASPSFICTQLHAQPQALPRKPLCWLQDSQMHHGVCGMLCLRARGSMLPGVTRPTQTVSCIPWHQQACCQEFCLSHSFKRVKSRLVSPVSRQTTHAPCWRAQESTLVGSASATHSFGVRTPQTMHAPPGARAGEHARGCLSYSFQLIKHTYCLHRHGFKFRACARRRACGCSRWPARRCGA
jgi:hypothetical protein